METDKDKPIWRNKQICSSKGCESRKMSLKENILFLTGPISYVLTTGFGLIGWFLDIYPAVITYSLIIIVIMTILQLEYSFGIAHGYKVIHTLALAKRKWKFFFLAVFFLAHFKIAFSQNQDWLEVSETELKILRDQHSVYNSSSLRPGFEGCSQIMNDPLYLQFVCLEQDEIFPEHKTRCFLLP